MNLAQVKEVQSEFFRIIQGDINTGMTVISIRGVKRVFNDIKFDIAEKNEKKTLEKIRLKRRNQEIYRLRLVGFSFKTIGKKFNISQGRARVIFIKVERENVSRETI